MFCSFDSFDSYYVCWISDTYFHNYSKVVLSFDSLYSFLSPIKQFLSRTTNISLFSFIYLYYEHFLLLIYTRDSCSSAFLSSSIF